MKLIIPFLVYFTLIVSPIMAIPTQLQPLPSQVPLVAIDINNHVQSYSKILKYVDTMKSQVLKDQEAFLKIYDSQRIEHKQEKKQLK